MIKFIQFFLFSSVLLMCWWVFAWPFIESREMTNPTFQSGSLITLIIFFSSILVLLIIRIQSKNKDKN